MRQRLPGITKVGYVNISSLPANITNKAICGMRVDINQSDITFLPTIGIPVCQIEDKFDNNSSFEKAKLEFSATELVPKFPRKAFVVITADGNAYLIGDDTTPPLMENKANTGEPSGESAADKYEIEFTARKALIQCYITQNQ